MGLANLLPCQGPRGVEHFSHGSLEPSGIHEGMEEDSQGGDPVGSRGGGSGAGLPGRAHGGDGRDAGVLRRRPARHGGRGGQDDGHGMWCKLI